MLFVGDSPGHDIAGPLAVGMQTALLAVRPPAPAQVEPDHVVASLHEVLGIVLPGGGGDCENA